MTIKTITIPQRDENRRIMGTTFITTEWNCPVCGREMGEPELKIYGEDDKLYAVHTWENSCYHITDYGDLKPVSQ